MIKLKFEFQNRTFMLPLNPENLEVSVANDTKKFDIIGLGQIAVPAQKGLRTISFECFFPAQNRPKKCVEFFENIMDSKKPVRFITEGLIKEVNMYMVIDDFSYDIRAGEEEDIYYSMSLTEYRPYGAKLEEIKSTANGNEVLPSTEDREDTKEPVTQTYVVKQGDSLWSITKNFSGSGGNWGSLYVINKEVIGGNPNLIYPGQVLTLPTEWKYVAVKVKSSTTTSNSTSNSTSSTNTSGTTTSSKEQVGYRLRNLSPLQQQEQTLLETSQNLPSYIKPYEYTDMPVSYVQENLKNTWENSWIKNKTQVSNDIWENLKNNAGYK